MAGMSSTVSIPWRTRALHRLAGLAGSVADMPPERLEAMRRPIRHNRLVATVTGPVHKGVRIEDERLHAGDGRLVRVRCYTPASPERSRPVLVFIHGGGWVLGQVENYDPLCSHLAAQAGLLVASVDYRLAPEHPAPAAIHDCLDVVRALPGALPGWGGDPRRIAIGGDSAGGNLSAVLTQQVRDHGGPRFAGQVLLYPSVDSTCLSRSKIEFARGPMLTRRDTDAYFAHYLGTGPDALSPLDPLISPALGDLGDLPPALVITAGLDPLRDEGARYALALRAAGVSAEHVDYPRAPHGFASFPGMSAGIKDHRQRIVQFLHEHLR